MNASFSGSRILIERIKNGDREAFDPLFARYSPRLAVWIYYRLNSQLRSSMEVDDLLQETLLRVFKEFDGFSYQGPGSFMRWARRIAEHVIVDAARFQGRLKRQATEMVTFRSPSNPDGADPADTRTPSRILSGQEKILALIHKLDALPENYRNIILMSKVAGLTTQEIATSLNKSREGVALLLCRALKQFRQALGTPTSS